VPRSRSQRSLCTISAAALCLKRDSVLHIVASPFLVQRNSRVNGGAFPLPTIRLETFGLVLPEEEITTTEASSLKAMPQQSNTS
jgi:hypothetical protein